MEGLTDVQVTVPVPAMGQMNSLWPGGWIFFSLKEIVKEPMFILLLVASVIYFITGNTSDGIFMVSAIILVSAISLYQDSRSRNALSALKRLTQPRSKLIRNGQLIEVSSEELVIGDLMMVEEGTSVPADGIIVQSNDFSLNESILTGESLSVVKSVDEDNNKVYQGTSVAGGLAICRVTAIGISTKLGQIGSSLESIREEKTPLQAQIGNFVKKMAVTGVVVFLIVWAINYARSLNADRFVEGTNPGHEYFARRDTGGFHHFSMALGAWRLMRMGVIVKQTKTVAHCSATVICADKTGTITETKWSLASNICTWLAKDIRPRGYYRR